MSPWFNLAAPNVHECKWKVDNEKIKRSRASYHGDLATRFEEALSLIPEKVFITLPNSTTIFLPPATTSASMPTPSQFVDDLKEFSVKVPEARYQYDIMESVNDPSIDRKDCKEIEMRREINPCTYRSAINLDPNASSSSTSMSITTSLGVILRETDAESKCGREQKQALKQNYDATKETNIERLSWLSTSHSSTEQSVKHSRGLKYGDVNTNSSDYVFTKEKNSFEAYPVQNWYTFTQTNVHKTVDFDEAEKQNQERRKHLDKWFPKQQAMKEKNTEDNIQNNNEKDTIFR
ncbi:unnamed protein product [Rotaria sordida]|uniref:Transcription initiation factor IIF subunit alpha n=1 Tax=Rotaria sordida TaxID=392033 RepID=A0A819T4J6_9BILA|nr:unnamed protein product [Rotaria sordida]